MRESHRCHPGRRANDSIAFGLFFRDLGRETKVSEFDGAVHVDQNVIALDIAVDEVELMHVVQTLRHL